MRYYGSGLASPAQRESAEMSAETDLFSDDMRRDRYAFYEQMRSGSPVHYVPPPFEAWMIFDYQEARRALTDHDTFSSQVPTPPHWFIFIDPPKHTKLRALISQAFTPRVAQTLKRASGTFRASC